MTAAILIVAKAPVAGFAKTRLVPRFGERGAAALAAAALLDTIATARRVRSAVVVIAHTGSFRYAERADEIHASLDGCTLIPQRGKAFGDRLMNAHRDATRLGLRRVVQIGMDTPQVDEYELGGALDLLQEDARCVALGPAHDGGWWAFGATNARGSETLPTVPMSRSDTATATRRALESRGLQVRTLPLRTDVDEPDDVATVAQQCRAGSEFATAVSSLQLTRVPQELR